MAQQPMKIALFGDVHLKAKRLNDVASAWSRSIQKARDLGCDYVLQAGDVFDHANIFGKEATVGTIYDTFLRPFTDGKSPKLVIVVGNHDIGGPDNKDALVPVDHNSRIFVYRTPSHISLDDKVGLVMLPWIDRATLMRSLAKKGLSPEDARKKIDELISSKLIETMKEYVSEYKTKGLPTIFLSHLEVTGAIMDSGMPQSGGMFEISPSTLASIGADIYALGHIHKRQHLAGLPRPNDGYLGAICQTNFGEEENKAGGRLIEIDDHGSIVKDEWLNDADSPRYFTVESLSAVSCRDIDYVKLRSEHRPDDLPAGVIFEKKPVKKDIHAITTTLDADSPVDLLLGEWGKRSGAKVTKEIMDIAKSMKTPQGQAGIGSWDSLDKVILKNITCHKDTIIDLSGIKGVVGIEGPNGSGKTSVMESVVFSLYGESPRHTAQELISTMSDKAGLIEVHFSSGGKKYIARRELKNGKTIIHKAFLFEGEDNPIAGPNVGAVNRASSIVVGDMALVLAGVFAAQSDSGNMVDLSPADRKQLFARLIGTDKFLEMATQARDGAKAAQATISATETRIIELKAVIEEVDALEKELERLRDENEKTSEEVEENTKKLNQINASIQEARDRETQRININSKIAELERKKKETEEEGRGLRDEWKGLLDIDQEKANDDLVKAKSRLEKSNEAKEQVSAIAQEKAALVSKAAEIQAEASRLGEERAGAHTKAVQDSVDQQKQIRTERQANLDKIIALLAEINNKSITLSSEIAQSCRKVDLIKGFPDQPVCQSCVLAKDCVEAKKELPSKQKELENLKTRIKNGEKKKDEYVAETDRQVSEVASPNPESFQKDVVEKINALLAEVEKVKEQAEKKKAAQEVLDLVEQHDKLAEKVRKAEQALEKARTAKTRVTTIEALLKKLREQHQAMVREIASLRESAPQPIDVISLKAQQKSFMESIEELNEKISEGSVSIGKQQFKIEENNRKIEELKKLAGVIAPQKLAIDALTLLASAFGRDGIPQMLVEHTIPRFEEIMNELVADFECGMEIKVISQRATKKGSLEDVIDILVNDGFSWREIRTWSGGENKLLKYLVRIAFAILQAERSGRGLKVLILDEAVDALDDDKMNDFMAMVMSLPKYFNQVFVISHNARVVSEIPCKIKFERVSLAHPCKATVSSPGS